MDALYIKASIFSFSTKADSAVRMFSNFASLSALVFAGTGMVSNRRERSLSPSIFRYTYRFGGKGRSSGSPFSIVPRQLPRLLKKIYPQS